MYMCISLSLYIYIYTHTHMLYVLADHGDVGEEAEVALHAYYELN